MKYEIYNKNIHVQQKLFLKYFKNLAQIIQIYRIQKGKSHFMPNLQFNDASYGFRDGLLQTIFSNKVTLANEYKGFSKVYW